MKIKLADISPHGFRIQESLPLDALNRRMDEGRENDIHFTLAPQVDITVEKTADGATIKGRVASKYTQPCSLCAKEVERDVAVELDIALKPRPADYGREAEEELAVADLGLVYYDHDQINAEDLIQEALILSLSPYWRPEADERGCCRVCGKEIDKPVQIGHAS